MFVPRRVETRRNVTQKVRKCIDATSVIREEHEYRERGRHERRRVCVKEIALLCCHCRSFLLWYLDGRSTAKNKLNFFVRDSP